MQQRRSPGFWFPEQCSLTGANAPHRAEFLKRPAPADPRSEIGVEFPALLA